MQVGLLFFKSGMLPAEFSLLPSHFVASWAWFLKFVHRLLYSVILSLGQLLEILRFHDVLVLSRVYVYYFYAQIIHTNFKFEYNCQRYQRYVAFRCRVLLKLSVFNDRFSVFAVPLSFSTLFTYVT